MGTTAEKLQAVLDSKAAIGTALEAKGVTVPEKFSEYAGAIDEISVGDTSVEDGLLTKTLSGEYSNDRVTSLGACAFYNCKNLTKVELPNVEIIYGSSFYNCTGLTKIDFPKYNSHIYGDTYYGCTGITTVNFPNALSLQGNCFRGCTKLETADFGIITTIAHYALGVCTSLYKLIIRTTSQVCTLLATSALTSTPIESGTGYIYVPDELVEDYKVATNWVTYADQIKGLSELEESE